MLTRLAVKFGGITESQTEYDAIDDYDYEHDHRCAEHEHGVKPSGTREETSMSRSIPVLRRLHGPGAAVLLAALVLAGCSLWGDDIPKDDLTGIWVTDDPRYAQCELRITDKLIIFTNGAEHLAVNYLKEISAKKSDGMALYEIEFEDKLGLRFTFAFYYDRSVPGGGIRLKNQKQRLWTKKSPATAVQ